MIGIIENTFFFIVFIGTLVFVHELGHFLVAKACDVKVTSFSLGFGPKLLGFVRGETEYKLCVLPLGGYVKMVGELPGVELPPGDAPRALSAKPLWQRSAVVLAGPAANLLFAFVVYFAMFTGNQTVNDTRLGVVSVGEPAWEAGLRPGDRVVEINNEPVRSWGQLARAIGERPGQRIRLVYERASKRVTTTVVPDTRSEPNIFQELEDRGKVGISLSYLEPILAVVDPSSPAGQAGLQTDDVVTHVNDRGVEAWHEVRQALAQVLSGAPVSVTVRRGDKSRTVEILADEAYRPTDTVLFSSADTASGYTGLVSKDSVVVAVDDDTPASQAGLKVGDRLLAVSMQKSDGERVERAIGVWGMDLAAFHGTDPRNEFVLTVQRGREVFSLVLKLLATEETDDFKNVHTRYVFGARNDPAVLGTYTYERYVGALEAAGQAAAMLWSDIQLIATGVYKLTIGKVPLDSMGGPIMLFVIAEKSAKRGIDHFLRMLAIISVNLGLLNLLPIPVLDGGHLLLYAVEAIRRRPPSIRFREISNMVGMALLLLLMVLVFSNDIMRFVLG